MRTHSLILALLLGLGAVGLAACENEGPAERLGEAVDEAAESTGEALEEAGEEMEEGAR